MSNYFPTPAQLQTFSLNGSGATAGSTSIILKSFKKIDGTLLAMSDFGNLGYGTLEPGTSLEEQISFSGLTQNLSNETCTLTGVRTVDETTPYTSTSGLATTHAGATTFVISNTAAFYQDMKNYIDVALSAGATPATTSANGIGKVSIAPIDSASPRFLGTNDYQNNYAADAGSTDAYAITLAYPPSAYANGQIFTFKANTVNTGAATLNVNSLGAKTIKKSYNLDLDDGDIKANQVVEVQYDGTNFQLLSPVPPNDFLYTVGALSPLLSKTYFNAQLPLLIATGSVNGATTTDVSQWIRSSTDVVILSGSVMGKMSGTGPETMTIESPAYGSTSGATIDFGHNNTIIMDCWVRLDTIQEYCWGFASATGNFDEVYNDVAIRIVFAVQDSGDKLYGSVSNGTTNTATEITGITLTNFNNYRVVADLGADTAYFYVNGVLKATVSTTFPTSGTVFLGYGRNANGVYDFTAPNFAIEMNP